jgi:murein DD-endopeptidase MepM/ murein hydrolase activator NlpD
VTLAPASAAPDPALRRAARDMEAILLRQLLRSSGAYQGGEGPGASVRADLFASALADAVEQAGGLGLAGALERSVAGTAPPPATAPAAAPLPSRPAAASPVEGGILPVAGHLTSPFGLRQDPFTGEPEEHDGVDVGAPEGAAIRVTADGVVKSAGPRGGYGFAVEVDHGNGLTTLYGHASELLVAPGQVVRAGQEIARVGSTGKSTGSHLHFEVRMGGRPVDPGRVLKAYAARVEVDPRSGP